MEEQIAEVEDFINQTIGLEFGKWLKDRHIENVDPDSELGMLLWNQYYNEFLHTLFRK